jgi:hypothetical protein
MYETNGSIYAELETNVVVDELLSTLFPFIFAHIVTSVAVPPCVFSI